MKVKSASIIYELNLAEINFILIEGLKKRGLNPINLKWNNTPESLSVETNNIKGMTTQAAPKLDSEKTISEKFRGSKGIITRLIKGCSEFSMIMLKSRLSEKFLGITEDQCLAIVDEVLKGTKWLRNDDDNWENTWGKKDSNRTGSRTIQKAAIKEEKKDAAVYKAIDVLESEIFNKYLDSVMNKISKTMHDSILIYGDNNRKLHFIDKHAPHRESLINLLTISLDKHQPKLISIHLQHKQDSKSILEFNIIEQLRL